MKLTYMVGYEYTLAYSFTSNNMILQVFDYKKPYKSMIYFRGHREIQVNRIGFFKKVQWNIRICGNPDLILWCTAESRLRTTEIYDNILKEGQLLGFLKKCKKKLSGIVQSIFQTKQKWHFWKIVKGKKVICYWQFYNHFSSLWKVKTNFSKFREKKFLFSEFWWFSDAH